MGWNNPDDAPGASWRSGSPAGCVTPQDPEAPISTAQAQAASGSRWSGPTGPVTPYAELHCHSNFSFLDGASGPDQLVLEAIRLGLHALAITDHDGFYGAPLFAETAQLHGGPERPSTAPSSPSGSPGRRTASPTPRAATCWCSPAASRATTGWPARSPTPSCAATRRAARSTTCDELAERGRGHWLVLTGCRKGAVRQALADARPVVRRRGAGPADRAVRPRARRGRADRPRATPTDSAHNDLLAALAADHGLPVVATNNVHYARPERAPAWPARWPRSGPGAAWPRWTAGCRRPGRPACGRGRRWRAGSPATRARWRARVDDRRRGRLRPPEGHPAAAQGRHPRRAHADRAGCAS